MLVLGKKPEQNKRQLCSTHQNFRIYVNLHICVYTGRHRHSRAYQHPEPLLKTIPLELE